MLSDSESDDEALQQLTINEHYAKAYACKKEREELANLKEKYGSDVESDLNESDDSEDTDEDEEGEELTPAVDAAILRTLARIKRKDPDIYDSKKDVFEEEQQRTKSSFSFNNKKEDKTKPLLLRQHILQSQLQSTSRSPSPEPAEPTHAEEQAALQKETISVFHTAITEGSADEDEDDILIPREKTRDEIEQEQKEYLAFLAREVGDDIGGLVTIERQGGASGEEDDNAKKERDVGKDEGKKEDKKKKRKNRKTKEQEDHDFLMNYILNRGWIDKSTRHIPKYAEITALSGQKKGKTKDGNEDEACRVNIIGNGNAQLDAGVESFDEEEFDEVAENFESSYNFRFEEPDAATITSHPREIASTVRREENPRKAARERKKQRKEEKLLQKREEVKRLKALKMKEIHEKLERVRREGGKSADDEALQQLDLEGDWDPEAHDKQMASIYGNDEGEGEPVDLEKPAWDDDIDITDIVPPEREDDPSSSSKSKKKRNDKKKKRKDDDDINEEASDGVDLDEMDADLVGSNTNADKKKALGEAMGDVYGLEFNDLVGDLPTRFKYTPVLPETYGLSATEILLADDADLNSLVGLRKLAAYRKDHGRSWDPHRKDKLRDFKKKLTEKRGFVADDADRGEEGGTKKRKGKKERQKAKLAAAAMTEEDPLNGNNAGSNGPNGQEDVKTDAGEPPKKKRKRRHKNSTQAEAEESR